MEWIYKALREPNNVMALASVAYVIVAVCTLLVIGFQAGIARRQVAISRDALNLERPWLLAEVYCGNVAKLLSDPLDLKDDPAAVAIGARPQVSIRFGPGGPGNWTRYT